MMKHSNMYDEEFKLLYDEAFKHNVIEYAEAYNCCSAGKNVNEKQVQEWWQIIYILCGWRQIINISWQSKIVAAAGWCSRFMNWTIG